MQYLLLRNWGLNLWFWHMNWEEFLLNWWALNLAYFNFLVAGNECLQHAVNSASSSFFKQYMFHAIPSIRSFLLRRLSNDHLITLQKNFISLYLVHLSRFLTPLSVICRLFFPKDKISKLPFPNFGDKRNLMKVSLNLELLLLVTSKLHWVWNKVSKDWASWNCWRKLRRQKSWLFIQITTNSSCI